MASKIVGVPSLGASLMITSPGDILIDVIRRFQVNYEGCSDTTPMLTESYQQLITRFEDDHSRLAGEVQQALERIFKRIFPTDKVNVSATAEMGTGGQSNTYTLVIKASISRNGMLYSVSPTIKLQNGIPIISNDKVTYVALSDLPSA